MRYLTFQEILQYELSMHHNLYFNRMEILTIFFAEINSNVSLDENGFLSYKNKTYDTSLLNCITSKGIEIYKKNFEMFYIDAFSLKIIEKFSKLVGCKNEGFFEEVDYFIKQIKFFDINSFTAEVIIKNAGKSAVTKEVYQRQEVKAKSYQKHVISWRENIHLFEDKFNYLYLKDRMNNF